jgi:crossover junction endodeoxyribonuclease RuvC
MILWIDPWVRKLGYAIITEDLNIKDSGILLQKKESPNREDQFQRMIEIEEYFNNLFKKNKITIISMEKLYFTKYNQNNAEFVFWIRAILIAMAIHHWCKILEFSPIELKKYITWNSKAEKMLVQKMIMKLFKLQDIPEYNDAADALWLAYLAAKLKDKATCYQTKE